MTSRISAGILLRLGNDWSVNLDASYGQARLSSVIDLVINAPRFDATRGIQALNDQLANQKVERFTEEKAVNSLADFNLRFGGELFDLPGGPVTLTGTTEFFRESTPGDFQRNFAGSISTPPRPSRQQDISAFFELRAPLISADSDLRLLRGLEMQLALRRDSYDVKVPGTLDLISGFDLNAISNHNSIVAETVGVRVSPSEDVTIRASASTGFTPATSAQLVSIKLTGASGGYSDPLRGGFQPINFTSRQDLIIGGSSSLRPQGTTTYSAGFILRPSIVPGFRVSLDYSRLYTTGEITNFAQGDRQYFINHEDQYPRRVVRAPLTPSDVAVGFTGGAITSIDTSYLQIGHSTVQAIDLGLDYRRSTSIGSLSFFGQATWEPEFVRSADPEKPSYNLAGRADGPLAWRANGGVRWYQSTWTAGLGFTFFGAQNGYSATPLTPAQLSLLNSTSASPVGTNSDYIPPQVYLDAFVALHSTLHWMGEGLTRIEARLGMKNILNAEPPLVASTFLIQQRNLGVTGFDYNPLGGYSPFGDPIGRRIELNVTLSL
jgi:hypothetical protein